MLIIGARGFAKQLIEVLICNGEKDIFFFDDISDNLPNDLYGFKIIRSRGMAEEYFHHNDRKFCLGIGKPVLRESMAKVFESLGGELISVISKNAHIARFVKTIGKGSTILTSAIVENDVSIGKGVLINSLAAVYHDSTIGDFVEIAPGAKILGSVKIGARSFIGANASILPGIQVGENVIIGAGAVVNKDVPANSILVGVPAKSMVK